ncbi:hypothetical protein Nepgr_014677 [Nepenthes gracilis]|uniref:Uncharacterized protein n=1 Tax=Nepenthes gracilis TaxID=150966 RepID=A0AAD3SM97_NEPGR|nr:hypothetical protein Nepgr_014677 [Nepenthes gracilis]
MDAARSKSLSPCYTKGDFAAHCSGPVRPSSPDVLGPSSASVSSLSATFGESAHSDSFPGAVDIKPFNSSTSGSSGMSILPPDISWAQVAKGSDIPSFGPLKFFPPPAELDPDSPLHPPAEVKQQCVEVDRGNPLPPKIRLMTGAAELALSVEVEIIYHSKPARKPSGVQYTQKHVPKARDYGAERMNASTCLPSDLVPGFEGGAVRDAAYAHVYWADRVSCAEEGPGRIASDMA